MRTGFLILGLLLLLMPQAWAEDGSCCVQGDCTDGTTDASCGDDGGLFDTRSCADRGECAKRYDIGGSCCAGIQCMDNIEKDKCEKAGGSWHEDQLCAERTDCTVVEQSCCLNGTCFDTMSEERCKEDGGAFEAVRCDNRSACALNPDIEGDASITPIPDEDNGLGTDSNSTPTGGGCASTTTTNASLWFVVAMLGLLLLPRRRDRKIV